MALTPIWASELVEEIFRHPPLDQLRGWERDRLKEDLTREAVAIVDQMRREMWRWYGGPG